MVPPLLRDGLGRWQAKPRLLLRRHALLMRRLLLGLSVWRKAISQQLLAALAQDCWLPATSRKLLMCGIRS